MKTTGSRRQTLARRTAATLAAFAIVAPPAPALAINIRDDVAAGAGGIGSYYDAANLFPHVGNLVNGGGNYCTGTLINARTVMTAAHCFYEDDGSIAPGLDTFGINFDPVAPATGSISNYASITLHSGYTQVDGLADMQDIALVALDTPVTSIAPGELLATVPAAGSTIYLVGYGSSGTGSNASAYDDDKRRIGTNILDAIAPYDLTVSGERFHTGGDNAFVFDFDDPLDPAKSQSGAATATSLEASSGGGDSGGALWVKIGQAYYVVALNNSSGNVLTGSGDGFYGETILYTPLTPLLDWIAANSPLRSVSASAGDADWSDAAHWSEGTVPDNFTPGFSISTPSRFYNVTLSHAGTTTLSDFRTIDTLSVAGSESALTIADGGTLEAEIAANVSAGSLKVDGRLVTTALNMAGGALTGAGTVRTLGATNSGGTIAPGNSIGTLTVNGDFTQGAGGTLAIEIDRTSADKLAVTGTAALGGTLAVGLLSGGTVPLETTRYTIVTAEGGVAGAFATVTDALPGTLSVESVDVGANDVTLTVAAESFAETASGGTNADIASALDSLRGTGDATVDAVLSYLAVQTPEVRNALFNQLMPVQSYAQTASGFAYATALSGQLGARLAAVRSGAGGVDVARLRLPTIQLASAGSDPEPIVTAMTRVADLKAGVEEADGYPLAPVFALPKRLGVFVSGDLSFGDTAVPGATQDFTTGAVTAGFDYRLTPQVALGLAATYGTTSSDISFGGSSESRAAGMTAYGAYQRGGWYADAYAGAAVTSHDSSRIVSSGPAPLQAQGETEGTTLAAGARLGYLARQDNWQFGPILAVDYAKAKTDAYDEKGAGAFSLSVSETEVSSLTTTLGVQAAVSFAVGGTDVAPYASAGWVHEFKDEAPVTSAAFAGAPGTTFQATGLAGDADWLRGGMGVSARIGEAALIGLGVETDIGRDDTNRTRISASLRFAL